MEPFPIEGALPARVNPDMITLARESRGMTQTQLATKMRVSQSKVSKLEHGLLTSDENDLAKVTDALNYPPTFFALTDRRQGPGSSCMHHRKQRSLGVTGLRRIHARVDIVRMQLRRLLRGIELDVNDGFARMDVDAFDGDVERIASLVRQSWGLPSGPITNLIDAIEGAGGLVVMCDFGSSKIDALSQLHADLPALLFVNKVKSTDRQRWSLAHEIGHLVLHAVPTPDLEEEADRFAAEFLLPEQEIRLELRRPVTLSSLAELKPRWRVSMQALAKRARDLDVITQRQAKYLFMQMGKLGWRRQNGEPIPLPGEEPALVREIIDYHRNQRGYSLAELARTAHVEEGEFEQQYLRRRHLRLAD